MKKYLKNLIYCLLIFTILICPLTGSEGTYYTEENSSTEQDEYKNYEINIGETDTDAYLEEDGSYTTKEDVANYLIEYNTLPDNFITKKEAKELGWSGGSLEPYAPGKCIGGDYFGNYEGALPEVTGRTYHECDIDTLGANSRGAKRIVYSDDGQIYYTEDHYETFTLLYGDDDES